MASANLSEPSAGTVKSAGRVVAKATGLMIVTILLSRVFGFVRESLLIYYFGQGALSDVYKQSFIIPDTLYFLIAGGALSSAFIPVFTKYLAEGNEKDAWKTFSTVACVAMAAATVFIVLGEIFAEPLSRLLSPGFKSVQVTQMAYLSRIILPAQIFFFLGGLMMGTLYSRNKFLAPAFGPLIYNIGIIAGGLITAYVHADELRALTEPGVRDALQIYFSKTSTPAQIAEVAKAYDIPHLLQMGTRAVSGYSWGALIGAFVGNFVFQLIAMRRIGMQFIPSFDLSHPGVKKVFALMLPVILGLSLPQVYVQINKISGTILASGAVTALDNANKLMQIPYGVFGQAFSMALFPTLSALAAKTAWSEFRTQTSQGLRGIVFMTLPASVLMMVLAMPIVRLVFEHGKLVTTQDTFITAFTLILYCVGVFAWSMQAILARSFYALHDTKTVVIVGSSMSVVFILLSQALVHSPWVHAWWATGGIALITSVIAIINTFVLMWILRGRIGGIEGRRIAASFGKIALACGVMALFSEGLYYALQHWHHFQMLPKMVKTVAELVVVGGFGAMVYAAASWLLKVEELQYAVSMFRGTVSKFRGLFGKHRNAPKVSQS